MTPSLRGLSLIVKKKKEEPNIHAFNNVRNCTVYHNINKSHEYNMTRLQLGLLRIQMH